MVTLGSGLVGGLLGSIATLAVLTALDDEPSPAAVVWAMYLGDGHPDHYVANGMAAHLVYGTLAGAVFVGLASLLSLGLATLGGALLWAVVWAALLLVVAVGLWMRVMIGIRPDADALTRTAGVHLVFGVVLGLWLAFVPGL